MNKKELIKYLILAMLLILTILFFNKVNKYLEAKISFEHLECSDRAYMIYKDYDDQIDEHRTADWALRNSECTKIEAEYQKGF